MTMTEALTNIRTAAAAEQIDRIRAYRDQVEAEVSDEYLAALDDLLAHLGA